MMFENTLEGAVQQLMDKGGGRNYERRGAKRVLRSPFNNPELESLYLGSSQTPHLPDPGRAPSITPPPASNAPHILQPTPGNQPVFVDHGLPTTPMFSDPNMDTGEVQSHVSHGLYGTQGESEVQYDDIWTTYLESDFNPQTPLHYNHVSPGDINMMLEAYGLESGIDLQTTPLITSQSAAAAATRSWTIPDEAESSNSGQARYTPVKMARRDPHALRQAEQTCDQSYPLDFGGESLTDPRLDDFMNMVMEDTISDRFSSTNPAHEHQSRRDSRVNPPFGYAPGNPSTVFRDHQNTQSITQLVADRREEPYNDFDTMLLAPGVAGIRQLGESRWAEQLLNLCAAAIASKNISRTQHLMWVLNDLASAVGDANQRLAAYGLRALFCRIASRDEAEATFLRPRHHDQEVNLGPKTVHRALVKFHDHTPWHQLCYSTTSQTLLEVCAGKTRLHVIDIGVGKGIEWPIFIDALVSRAGGPPSILRLTMIRELRKESVNVTMRSGPAKTSGEAADFMTRLVKFASLLGLHVEVNIVTKPLECVTREDLVLRDGEILSVVCHFRLHRLSEEEPEPHSNLPPTRGPQLSPRSEFLDFLFKLEPHVFIVSDNDCDHCSHDFLTRFQNVIEFWWRCVESMDIGYNGRNLEERQIIEYEVGMMLLNQVACEGIARVERNESHQQWSRRIKQAGFVPKELSEEAKKVARTLVQNHSEFWDVVFADTHVVTLLWRKQPTTFTSIWKTPSCSKSLCKCNMLHS